MCKYLGPVWVRCSKHPLLLFPALVMSCPARLLLAGHMLSKVCAMWTGFSFHFFLPSLLDLIMPWCWLHGLLNFFWLRNISLSCVPLPRRWTLGMFPNAWSYVADWVASLSSGTWTTSTHRWYTLQAVLVLLLSSLSPCLFLIPLWCCKIFGYKDAVLVLLLCVSRFGLAVRR